MLTGATSYAFVKEQITLSDQIGGELDKFRYGKTYSLACCPFHNDRNPSFAIYDDTGRYRCFGCGAEGDIFDYYKNTKGLNTKEVIEHLGYDKDVYALSNAAQYKKSTGEYTGEYISGHIGEYIPWEEEPFYCSTPNREGEPLPSFDIKNIWSKKKDRYDTSGGLEYYEYTHPDGSPHFYVVRKMINGKKQTLPVSYDYDLERWAYGLSMDVRPMFNLHEVNSGKPILIVEGEKCAIRAKSTLAKYATVSWCGGANAVSKTDWSPLSSLDVTIWPDNDEQGFKAAQDILAYLPDAKIIKIENKPPKWDIADWISDGANEQEIYNFIDTGTYEINESIFPKDLLEGAGMVKELAAYFRRVSKKPHPLLAMGAALSVMATLSSQKFMTEDKICPNLYVVTLASSGSGKSFPLHYIKQILAQIGAKDLSMGAIGSTAGLTTNLHKKKGRGLLLIDEFGEALADMCDKNSPHKRGIIGKMLALYTLGNSYYQDDALSQRAENSDPIVINKPHLNLYGTTVPNHFWQNINSDRSIDGFIARLMILEGVDQELADNDIYSVDDKLPPDLLAYLQTLGKTPVDILNSTDKTQGTYDYDITIVPYTNTAREHMRAFDKEMGKISAIAESEGDFFKGSLYKRAYEQASKFALLNRETNNYIHLPIVELATRFTKEFISRTYKSAKDNIFDSDFGKQSKKLEIYLKRKRGWVSRRDIVNAFRMPIKRLDDIINYLLEAELMKKEARGGGQRGITMYKYVKP